MTNSQLKKLINEEIKLVVGGKKSTLRNNKRRLNESGGEYLMYEVLKKEIELIGKAYSEFEEESIENYGPPIEDDDYDGDGDGWDEWSTREAKVEILEEVLKVLNKYSDYNDLDIVIK